MVTYSDLFQFCILMVTVIGLVIKVCNGKKK
ncbi:MAG: putative holin-like toxin [Oscillospiraceae bacterium]